MTRTKYGESVAETRTPSPALPATMRAIVQDRYGGPDVLEVRTVDRPEPGPSEVLIEVHAAGVDRGVWHLMAGLPYLVRLGFGLRRPKNPIIGLDAAGRVVAVGDQVTRFRPGDEVFGIAKGSFAEYAVAEEDKLAHKPNGLGFEEAAVSSISGLTALQALTDVGRVEPGDDVLIIGASGGVGTFAVQLAKAYGAHVTAINGPAMVETVRGLGADRVIDYTAQDFATEGHRYDLILDIGGRNSLRRLRGALAPKGTLVIVGGEDGNRLTGGVGRQLRGMLLSPFVGPRLTTFISKEHHSDIERLADHIERGEVAPVIGRRFPLAEAADALRHMEQAPAGGKSVIVI